MFRPNLIGTIQYQTGFDVHSRPILGAELPCPFAKVNMNTSTTKTTVRADSSASRGAADQFETRLGRILIVKLIEPQIEDVFGYQGNFYRISGVHIRNSVLGGIDHYDCEIESLP